MRVPFSCCNVQTYLENPKNCLPIKLVCPNNPEHRPCWNTRWKRGLLDDHVHTTTVPIFNGYCEICHETISFWPEFILPYAQEPLETFEQVVIDYLQGISISKIAAGIGYNPRTVSRWLKRIFSQAKTLEGLVIRRIIRIVGTTMLPLTMPGELIKLMLAWLRSYADWSGFTRLRRLIGLCNLLGKGDWDLWGAPLGKAKSRTQEARAPD